MSPKRKRNETPREQPPRKIRLTDHFAADADYWARHAPAVHRKLLRLVSATVSDPFRGIGKPEPLKHDLQGLWSRRLTHADRVVYEVTTEFVTFLSARHHYPRQGWG